MLNPRTAELGDGLPHELTFCQSVLSNTPVFFPRNLRLRKKKSTTTSSVGPELAFLGRFDPSHLAWRTDHQYRMLMEDHDLIVRNWDYNGLWTNFYKWGGPSCNYIVDIFFEVDAVDRINYYDYYGAIEFKSDKTDHPNFRSNCLSQPALLAGSIYPDTLSM